jgi:hypothetical protein
MKAECRNCKHWEKWTLYRNKGDCIQIYKGTRKGWSLGGGMGVKPSFWCRYYKAKALEGKE